MPRPPVLPTLLRDGLRAARHVVRKGRRRIEEIVPLPAAAAAAAADIAGLAAGALKGESDRAGIDIEGAMVALGGALDNPAPDDSRAAFSAALRQLMTAALGEAGYPEALVAEGPLAAAFRRLFPKGRPSLVPAGTDGATRAALVALEAIALDPVRRLGAPAAGATGLADPAAAARFSALAAMLATLAHGRSGGPAEAFLPSAATVVMAREDRFAAALAGAYPVALLAREFAAAAPHLP